MIGKQVLSLLLQTQEGGRVCKPLCVKKWDRFGEKTMVGDPKVSFFFFFNLRMRSFAAAKAHIHGAHPWVVRSNFLTDMPWVQRKAPVGGLGSQGHIPLFSVTEREKGQVGSRRCSTAAWRRACWRF